MKKTEKNNRGVSLIVLVITIVVMIILATVVILSLNSNDTIENVNKAEETNNIATVNEIVAIAYQKWVVDERSGKTDKTDKEYIEDYLKSKKIEIPEGYQISITGSVIPKTRWDGTIADSFARGTGTENDPYVIETAAELAYLAEYCNESYGNTRGKYFKLVSNIDLNNLPWTPIGIGNSAYFNGYFDGGNNKISNIYVNKETQFAGLFGFVDYCTIQNIILESGNITCIRYAGGIAGVQETNGIITNCVNKASITGRNEIGGIVGIAANEDLITNCINYGNISGENKIGQIAGNEEGINFTNCQKSGSITILN